MTDRFCIGFSWFARAVALIRATATIAATGTLLALLSGLVAHSELPEWVWHCSGVVVFAGAFYIVGDCWEIEKQSRKLLRLIRKETA